MSSYLLRSLTRVFCASSLPSSWPSACTPRRHPRWRREPLARSLEASSLNERLVCEPLSRSAIYEAFEPRQGMVLDVAFVQSKRKLVNIAVKMLRAGVMIDANQPALQDGKDAFDAIGRRLAANVFARAVIDGIVDKTNIADTRVRAAFVGMQGRSGLDMPVNGALDRFFIRRLDWHSDRTTATLSHAKHGRLADRAAPGLEFLGLVLVLFEPSYIGFVYFYDALQHFELRSARFAQPVKNEPSGLLSDANFLGKLHGRNALARRHKQIHRVNPLMQRNVGALENRSGSDREVLFALVAAVEAALASRDSLAKAANRAARPIRPKAALKIDPRRFLVREHLEKLESGNCALGHRATPWLRTKNRIKFLGSQVYNPLNLKFTIIY